MGRTARVGSLPIANAERQVLCGGLMGCGTAPLTSSLTLVAEGSVNGPRQVWDRKLCMAVELKLHTCSVSLCTWAEFCELVI